MEIRVIYRTFFLIILVQSCYSITRKLNLIQIQNNKDEICRYRHPPLNLVKAEGANDVLNYLWSFIHNPSVLVTLTSPSTKVNIIWPGISQFSSDSSQSDSLHHCNPESIEFSEEPIFSYGISIQKIIEFNDLNDTGNMNSYDNPNINILNPRLFKWHLTHAKVIDEHIELEVFGDSYSDPKTKIERKGDIKLVASVFGKLDRLIKKPSMLHSENTTQIDLTIDKFETNSTFTKSRFAVEILVVSNGNPNSSLSIIKRKNIDDQHSPGVFKVTELKSPPLKLPYQEENVGMYLEWRPISYTSDARIVTNSMDLNQYPIQRSTDAASDTQPTIFYPYYSANPDHKLSQIIIQKMNVSFGVTGDSFYDKKNGYASWTFLVGYSHSLDEQISSLTILIISIVVVVPLLPIICYSSFIFYRRILKTDNEFQNMQ